MDEKIKYGQNNYCPICFKPHSEGSCECMKKLYGVMKNNPFTDPKPKTKKKKK
jgi:hypothetical protein